MIKNAILFGLLSYGALVVNTPSVIAKESDGQRILEKLKRQGADLDRLKQQKAMAEKYRLNAGQAQRIGSQVVIPMTQEDGAIVPIKSGVYPNQMVIDDMNRVGKISGTIFLQLVEQADVQPLAKQFKVQVMQTGRGYAWLKADAGQDMQWLISELSKSPLVKRAEMEVVTNRLQPK